MTPFIDILAAAQELQGGMGPIEARLPKPGSDRQLRAVSDADYLSLMSRRIFRAGLKHHMVDARWPAFEEVFDGFDIDAVRLMSDEQLEALMQDRRLIRHWGKVKSVRINASAIHELRESHGGMGGYLAAWPASAITALWDDMKKRFAQMGGNSGPYFLRMAGKDTFVLTRDVVRALNQWGAITGEPKTRAVRELAQSAFNHWSGESGRPVCQVSMILALSVR